MIAHAAAELKRTDKPRTQRKIQASRMVPSGSVKSKKNMSFGEKSMLGCKIAIVAGTREMTRFFILQNNMGTQGPRNWLEITPQKFPRFRRSGIYI